MDEFGGEVMPRGGIIVSGVLLAWGVRTRWVEGGVEAASFHLYIHTGLYLSLLFFPFQATIIIRMIVPRAYDFDAFGHKRVSEARVKVRRCDAFAP